MPLDLGPIELTIFLITAAFYFLPSIVAAIRRSRRIVLVFALNGLLGWTGIGWVAALALSLMYGQSEDPPSEAV